MSDKNVANPDWHVSQGEHFKALFDYLKHVSALSTGAIVLVATFLEKVFQRPVHSWAVGVAIGALFVSLASSLAGYSIMVLNFPRSDRPFGPKAISDPEKAGFVASLMLTWLAMIIGIGMLAYFFLANWYA